MIKSAVCFALTCLVSMTSPLAAEPLSGRQVSDLILEALAKASQDGIPVVSLHRGFPPCASQPDISPSESGWGAVDITCLDTQGWSRRIRITGGQAVTGAPRPATTDSLSSPAIVLTDSLPKGTVLSRDHLAIGTLSGIGQDGQVSNMDNIIGRRLKVNLGVGQALLARHLDYDWLVREGNPVTIQVDTGPILIETGGIALQSGQLGEAIEVSNVRSGRTIHVTVIGPNKTKVRPNIR